MPRRLPKPLEASPEYIASRLDTLDRVLGGLALSYSLNHDGGLVSLGMIRHSLEVADLGNSPAFFERLGDIMGMRDGWNGPAARAVKPEAAAHLLSVLVACAEPGPSDKSRLRLPQLVPLPCGGMQAEWVHGSRDLLAWARSDDAAEVRIGGMVFWNELSLGDDVIPEQPVSAISQEHIISLRQTAHAVSA